MVLLLLAFLAGTFGALFFVLGAIFTALVAIGNKHTILGWGMIVMAPIALWYCYAYRDETAYPRRFVYSGFVLLIVATVLFYFSPLELEQVFGKGMKH